MTVGPDEPPHETVSRSRYDRERRAREEAETLLEAKSRELFEANENLERLVAERTAELTQALAAAREAGEMRARFLAVMSHEIRTPLGGLMGMLDLLRDEPAPAATRDLIDAALRSAESLKRIVDDVLDLSALDAGKMRFETEPVDLRALATGICALLEPRAAAKGISFAVAIADAVPERLLCDATRLRQVLANLCDNAVKFSDQGTVTLSADVRPEPGGELLQVRVSDQGRGVAEADRPRLFADFGQLDPGLTKRTEGTGLGLSICRRIVEGLGGRIGVDGAPDAGAAFWFEIPLRRPSAEATGREPESRPVARPSPSLPQGLRILVAEDNPINRRLIDAYLTRLGAGHDMAVNGSEAVRMAGRARYDAILMDIAMPEMDGISATVAIRKGHGPSRDAPVIAFTAHVMPSVRRDCLAAGMSEVLAKPTSFEEIAAALAQYASAGAAVPAEAAAPDAPAALAALIPAFVEDAKVRIGAMRAALARGDRAAIAAEAHSLGGAAGLLGARDAHEIARAVEEGAHHLDDGDIAAALDDLAGAVGAMLP